MQEKIKALVEVLKSNTMKDYIATIIKNDIKVFIYILIIPTLLYQLVLELDHKVLY